MNWDTNDNGTPDRLETYFNQKTYSTYMSIWNSGSNPTVPEYTYGDKINIKAQVHNTGDAAVNDNVSTSLKNLSKSLISNTPQQFSFSTSF